jgi:hypothetical protein
MSVSGAFRTSRTAVVAAAKRTLRRAEEGGEPLLRGDLATNRPRFRLQPLTNDCGEVAAITVEMMGLTFVLRLEPPEVIGDVILDKPSA